MGILNGLVYLKRLDLESGLLFTGRGSKAETYFNGGNDYVKSTFNPYYASAIKCNCKGTARKKTALFLMQALILLLVWPVKSKQTVRLDRLHRLHQAPLSLVTTTRLHHSRMMRLMIN